MKRNYIVVAKQRRAIYFKIGLIVALSSAILAFRWTVHPSLNNQVVLTDFDQEVIDIIPRTVQERNKILPPPVPPQTDEIIPDEQDFEFTDQLIPEKIEDVVFDDNLIEDVEQELETNTGEIITPPVIPEEDEGPDFFTIVEEMPIFGNCTDLPNKAERKLCSDRSILRYLSKEIRYPSVARENGIQGTVVLRFIINEQGMVTDAKIIRDVGGGCGQEALRVVQQMPKWIPGAQRHRKVKVQMNLPVNFRLQN